jgi:hypothetical protein
VCIYAMTGAILLYDHSTPSGVFYKSPVQVKKCIKELKQHDMQQLQNLIRYSSIHFNDDTTPSSARRSLEYRHPAAASAAGPRLRTRCVPDGPSFAALSWALVPRAESPGAAALSR